MASPSAAAPAPLSIQRETASFFSPKSLSWTALIDLDGRIRSLSGSLPWPNSIPAGYSYYRLLPRICGDNPARCAAVKAGIQAVAASGQDSFTLEFPGRWLEREIRVRVTASRSGEAPSAGVLVAHTDAGDAPSAGLAEHESAKLEALGRLTAGVAHDFANLLTLILGYSEMLSRAAGQNCIAELEEIRKAAQRGAGVTAQILDYIRNEETRPAAVNLNELVAALEKLLRPIIGEHIALSTSLSPDLGLVNAEPAQLTRVVMNLVLNARDAMPGGGALAIRTANEHLLEGRFVVLTVSDTGQGMDPETLGHIFQPFFTTKKPGLGTGLGLNAVYRIVKQIGGDIRVSSEAGMGTAFTVYLPLAPQPALTEEPPPPRRANAGNETILLAEDEDAVRRLIKSVLTTRGYRVHDAADARRALELFERHFESIDLLLTDMVMPGINGRDLARRVLASKPGLPVVYMSGYTDDLLLATGALGPGISFLRKPLLPDDLAEHVRGALDAAK
jgi:signal transduction histidine kinase